MNNPIDSIRDDIIAICNDEYKSCSRNNSYFIAENQEASRVKQNILSKLRPDYAKHIYVDSVSYILDLNGNTFITILGD